MAATFDPARSYSSSTYLSGSQASTSSASSTLSSGVAGCTTAVFDPTNSSSSSPSLEGSRVSSAPAASTGSTAAIALFGPRSGSPTRLKPLEAEVSREIDEQLQMLEADTTVIQRGRPHNLRSMLCHEPQTVEAAKILYEACGASKTLLVDLFYDFRGTPGYLALARGNIEVATYFAELGDNFESSGSSHHFVHFLNRYAHLGPAFLDRFLTTIMRNKAEEITPLNFVKFILRESAKSSVPDAYIWALKQAKSLGMNSVDYEKSVVSFFEENATLISPDQLRALLACDGTLALLKQHLKHYPAMLLWQCRPDVFRVLQETDFPINETELKEMAELEAVMRGETVPADIREKVEALAPQPNHLQAKVFGGTTGQARFAADYKENVYIALDLLKKATDPMHIDMLFTRLAARRRYTAYSSNTQDKNFFGKEQQGGEFTPLQGAYASFKDLVPKENFPLHLRGIIAGEVVMQTTMTEARWWHAKPNRNAWNHILSKTLALKNTTYTRTTDLAADVGSSLWWATHYMKWQRGTSAINEVVIAATWLLHGRDIPEKRPYDCMALIKQEADFIPWYARITTE